MELAGIELRRVIFDLNKALVGYYVNNIFWVNPQTILLRLGHPTKPAQKILVSAGRGIWLTRYPLEREGVAGLVRTLRRELGRMRVREFSQPGEERIACIAFSYEDRGRKLYAEFFGEGNIVLTDEAGVILGLLRPLRVRHRRLSVGLVYTLPPARGLEVHSLRAEDLAPLKDSPLEVSKWLGRRLSLSRKYVEEALGRAGVQPNLLGKDLGAEQLAKIYSGIAEVARLSEAEDSTPILLYEEGQPVDFAPFPLQTYAGAEVRRAPSFMEALDEAFSSELMQERDKASVEPLRQRLAELERAMKAQGQVMVELKGETERLKNLARMLHDRSAVSNAISLTELLEMASRAEGTVDMLEEGRGLLSIGGAQLKVKDGLRIMTLSSRLYDEAKKLEKKAAAVKSARDELEAERARAEERLRTSAAVLREAKPKPARPRRWFERYRWFRTSGNLLALGGRDAASNTAIVRKHLEDHDLVFHADIVGSPFFVLKGGQAAEEESITEVGKAVVSFSRAWAGGLATADAYWVKPHQVKLRAPSGMYLPKGSFMVEGKKNTLKNLEVKVAIGVEILDDDVVVVGGPPTAIKEHSILYAVLVPERVKATDTAKKVKSQLIGLLTNETAELLKRKPVDDFLRAMPPGGGKIVQKGLGRQKG